MKSIVDHHLPQLSNSSSPANEIPHSEIPHGGIFDQLSSSSSMKSFVAVAALGALLAATSNEAKADDSASAAPAAPNTPQWVTSLNDYSAKVWANNPLVKSWKLATDPAVTNFSAHPLDALKAFHPADYIYAMRLKAGGGPVDQEHEKMFSFHSPVFIKIGENMMCITQVGDELHFLRTSSGTVQVGGQVSAGVGSLGGDTSQNHIYMEINPLEAIAQAGGNWQTIQDSVLKCHQRDTNAPSPELVRKTLEPLAARAPEAPLYKMPQDKSEAYWDWVREHASIGGFAKQLAGNFGSITPDFSLTDPQKPYIAPVFIRLDDGQILKIKQEDSKAKYYISVSGYPSTRINATLLGFGGEITSVTGDNFTEIREGEAAAYVNNDGAKIYGAVQRQAAVIENSVSPDLVKNFAQ